MRGELGSTDAEAVQHDNRQYLFLVVLVIVVLVALLALTSSILQKTIFKAEIKLKHTSAYWQGAQPIAVLGYRQFDGTLRLYFQNKAGRPITINSVGVTYSGQKRLSEVKQFIGNDATLTVDATAPPCEKGEQAAYYIEFNYATSEQFGLSWESREPLSSICET
jgi:hypothetical protein